MRISSNQMPRDMAANIETSLYPVQKNNEEISTGKRVNQPSDDPLAAGRIVDLNSEVAQNEGYAATAVQGDSRLELAASILGQVHTLLRKAESTTIQGLNSSTYSQTDLMTLSDSIESALQQCVALANTRQGGDSIFAGFQTATTAFGTAETGGSVTSVIYQGDEGVNQARVGEDMAVTVNLPGDAVFDAPGSSVFGSLMAIRDAMRAGDQSGMDAGLSQLQAAQQTIATAQAHAGALEKTLQSRESALEGLKTNLTTDLSANQDADMVTAAASYQEALTVYNAGVQAAGMVAKLPTIIDFL